MHDILVITGPTATGKTRLAAMVADRMGGEVISADSRQVYRGMDIGTGKDLSDYTVDGRRVPVHMVDIVDAGYRYNVFEYQRDFLKVFEALSAGVSSRWCAGLRDVCRQHRERLQADSGSVNSQLRSLLAGRSLEELTEYCHSTRACITRLMLTL